MRRLGESLAHRGAYSPLTEERSAGQAGERGDERSSIAMIACSSAQVESR